MNPFAKLSVFFLTVWVSLPAVGSGFSVGNGGDVVVCNGSDGVLQEGVYARDYLLSDASLIQRAHVSSLEESFARIQKILHNASPILEASLQEFAADWMNSFNYSERRVWEPAPFGLAPLSYAESFLTLPKSCLLESGEPHFVQAVIRVFAEPAGLPSEKRLYKYDPNILNALKETEPEQLSFLAIHEWLWEFSHEVEVNRRINVFLHRANLETMDPEQLRDQLKQRGLKNGTYESSVGLQVEPFECTGPSITRADIELRFGAHNVTKNFTSVTADAWVRNLVCPEGASWCRTEWRHERERIAGGFGDARFLLWYKSIHEPYPVKIANLKMMKSGVLPMHRDNALVHCTPPESATENMTCVFGAKGRGVLGDIGQQDRMEFAGKWTRTCFSLSTQVPVRSETVRSGLNVELLHFNLTHMFRWPD